MQSMTLARGSTTNSLHSKATHSTAGTWNTNHTGTTDATDSNADQLIGSFRTQGAQLREPFPEDWNCLVPDNHRLVSSFGPDGLDPVQWWQGILLALPTFIVVCISVLMFSDIGGIDGLLAYTFFFSVGKVLKGPMVALSVGSVLALRALGWNVGQHRRTLRATVLTAYVLLSTCCCFVDSYPHAPLVCMNLQIPLLFGVSRRLYAKRFPSAILYRVIAVICLAMALLLLSTWCCWMNLQPATLLTDAAGHRREATWLESSEHRFFASRLLLRILEDLRSPPPAACDASRKASVGEAGKLGLTDELACGKVRLMFLMICFGPAMQAIWLLHIAAFCSLRALLFVGALSTGADEYSAGIAIADVVFWSYAVFVSISFLALWCWAQLSAYSLASSLVVTFAMAGISSLTLWAHLSVKWSDLIKVAAERTYVLPLSILLVTDWFKAFCFALAAPCVVALTIYDLVCRQLQRILQVKLEGSPYFTRRGERVRLGISAWHWGSVLEKTFWWCMGFIAITVFAGQLLVVLLSRLNASLLETQHFKFVAYVFCSAGLVMLLIPLVPGILVYILAGIIIIRRAMQEPDVGFWQGAGLAIAGSLALKLSAVVILQNVVGRVLGNCFAVRKILGAHRMEMRAIEHILLQRRLPLMKVLILCGCPEWHTSVLSGILRVGIFQTLLGTLPVLALIVPCVLAGAFFLEDKWSGLSSLMIMFIIISQGCLSISATWSVLWVMQQKGTGLMQWRQEHEKAQKLSRRLQTTDAMYSLCVQWENQNVYMKVFLVSSASLSLFSSYVAFFMSSTFLPEYGIASELHSPHIREGLQGEPLSLLLPEGYFLLVVLSLAMACRGIYSMLAWARFATLDRYTRMLAQDAFGSLACSAPQSARLSLATPSQGGHPECPPQALPPAPPLVSLPSFAVGGDDAWVQEVAVATPVAPSTESGVVQCAGESAPPEETCLPDIPRDSLAPPVVAEHVCQAPGEKLEFDSEQCLRTLHL